MLYLVCSVAVLLSSLLIWWLARSLSRARAELRAVDSRCRDAAENQLQVERLEAMNAAAHSILGAHSLDVSMQAVFDALHRVFDDAQITVIECGSAPDGQARITASDFVDPSSNFMAMR